MAIKTQNVAKLRVYPKHFKLTLVLIFQDHISKKRIYEIGKCNIFQLFPKLYFPGSLTRSILGGIAMRLGLSDDRPRPPPS